MLKIEEGHKGTLKKIRVSRLEECSLLYYENTNTYIGTLGHRDTHTLQVAHV